MAKEKKQQASGFFLIVVGLVFVAVSLYYYVSEGKIDAVAQTQDIEATSPIEAPIAEAQSAEAPDATQTALAPRTLGSDEAPVKIREFASLSCGHCATFHKDTLPELKETYIDTGKVQIIFTEFPLNRQAVEGAMIARCLPVDQYVPFTSALFADQEGWAFAQDYPAGLVKKAEEFGMDKAAFDSCLANETLRNGIIENMQAAARQWSVNATPTFVVDNTEIVNGAKPFAEFQSVIDAALAGKTPAQ